MQETVLITGVSREKGLGFETATQLTAAGYKVLISAPAALKKQQP